MKEARVLGTPCATPSPLLSLWLLFLLVVCVFAAVDQQACAQQYVFRPYRQSQGLQNLSVNALAADRRGFLWVATDNGVYRFLGSSFERFGSGQGGIREQTIRQVYAAPDGSLWVGGEALYRWTGQSFQAMPGKPIAVMNNTSIAFEAPGRLLVLSGERLYRLRYSAAGKALAYDQAFSPAQVAAHPVLAQLQGVSILRDGTLWMACGRRLCSLKTGVLTEWASAQGVPPDTYRSMLEDYQGAVWAVGQKHVLELPAAPGREAPVFLRRDLPAAQSNGVYQLAHCG